MSSMNLFYIKNENGNENTLIVKIANSANIEY